MPSCICGEVYSGWVPVTTALYGASSAAPSKCRSWSVMMSTAKPFTSSQSTRCVSAMNCHGLRVSSFGRMLVIGRSRDE